MISSIYISFYVGPIYRLIDYTIQRLIYIGLHNYKTYSLTGYTISGVYTGL